MVPFLYQTFNLSPTPSKSVHVNSVLPKPVQVYMQSGSLSSASPEGAAPDTHPCGWCLTYDTILDFAYPPKVPLKVWSLAVERSAEARSWRRCPLYMEFCTGVTLKLLL